MFVLSLAVPSSVVSLFPQACGPGVILALLSGVYVMAKRIFRRIIKGVAVFAALVFVFDRKDSGTAGIMGAVAVLFLCFVLWQIFDLGAEDGAPASKPEE